MSPLEINRPFRKASASYVSLSGEESFPNPNISLLDGRTQRTTRSLSSSDEDSCLTSPQTDVLSINTTSPIRLSCIPFTPLYSPPKRVTKLAMLKSNEVPPEVELMISKFFEEFGNTDMLPVLRGIFAFKIFRYKAETQNQMISPYIEKSLSIPLRYKNMEYNLRITPLTKRVRSCSSNQAMLGRRAIGMTRWTNNSSFQSNSKHISDISYENCPIKLLETSQTKQNPDTPAEIQFTNLSRNKVRTPSIIRFNSSLETSNTFVPTSSYENCPIKLLETSQTREDNPISDTSSRTQLTTIPQINVVRRPNNIPVKLLDTSSGRDILCHNVNLTTPLPLASPNCSIRILGTPDILASNSRSICQALSSRPSGYRPLCNSAPSKRTFSELDEVNLSKRVRLNYYTNLD